MSEGSTDTSDTADGAPEIERRHANRVQVTGYEFETAEGSFEVVNLSIGGIRLAYGERAPFVLSQSVAGTLTGGATKPVDLTVEVVWVDESSRSIGCTFPVLGRNIAAQLLEILI